jgi:hypothetical protein
MAARLVYRHARSRGADPVGGEEARLTVLCRSRANTKPGTYPRRPRRCASALSRSSKLRPAEVRGLLREVQSTAQDWVIVATVLLTVVFVYAALLNLSLFAHGWA